MEPAGHDTPDRRLARLLGTWWHGEGPPDLEALQAAVESLPLAVLVLEAPDQGPARLLAWNEAYTALTGWEPRPSTPFSALPYRTFLPDRTTLLPPGELPGPRAARAGAPVAATPVHMLRRDGTWRVLSTSAAPLAPGPGGERRAVAVILDVTEAHQAQQLRSRLDLLSSRSRDAMTLVRLSDLTILEANDAAVALWGYPRSELVGMTARQLRAPEGRAETLLAFDAEAAASGGGALLHAVHQRKDGTTFQAEVSSAPATLDGEKVLVAVVRDVSERARAEERLRRSREELRALAARLDAVREEEKARIARDLHDEMGQVLTGLRIDLDLVEERLDALPAEVVGTDLIERVVDASALVARAVESMRTTVASLRPAALDRLGLAAALRQEGRAFEERTGVVCAVEAPDGLAPAPAADTALFRIAQEALTNVARHARARRVELRLGRAGGDVVLSVTDDGQGLPAAGDREMTPGAGLGLLGMRERTERLGGTFSIEPVEGGGTRLTARVPAGGTVAVRTAGG